MTGWVVYAIAVGAVLSAVGSLLDRSLRLAGSSTRWSWLFAMVASAFFLLPPWFGGDEREVIGSSISAGLPLERTWNAQLDRGVLFVWLLATLILLIQLLVARRSMKFQSRAWRSVEVDGTPVLVSDDIGPGVTLFSRPHIVMPAWTFGLEPSARALLIDHEREHVRARDHWCLAAGFGLLVLFPINPFLWWQFTRLKLAIEMDCDARVLSGRRDVRTYAALLLDVGQRCRAGRLVFAAFAAPPHAIERRIRMMLDPKPGARRGLAALSAAGAVAGVILACQTPEPSAPDVAVREALGILPAPPPPPPPPPTPEPEAAAEPFSPQAVDERVFYEARVGDHPPVPKNVLMQRLHAKLKEMPPPPPPAPLPGSTPRAQ